MHRRRLSSLFECTYCGRRFVRESQLDLHNELTAQRVKAHCAFCRSLADDPKALHLHALTHNKIRPYECHLCKRKFVSLLNLKSHNTLHLAGRIPTVYFGPHGSKVKEEPQSSDDEDDSVESSGDDEYDEYVMSDDHSLNKHLKFKIDWKIYSSDPLFKNAQVALDVLKILICQTCGKAVMSLYDNGLTLDEGLTAPTKCLGCQGGLVPWNGNLSGITSSIHLLESPPLECISCNHVFPSMAKLKKHMQVHAETVGQAAESSGESSASIDSWSTRFSGNSGLLDHPGIRSRKLDRLDSTSTSQAASGETEPSSSLETTPALSIKSSPCFRERNETTPKRVLRVKLCRISMSSPEVRNQCDSAGDRLSPPGSSSTERASFAGKLGRKRLRSSRVGGEDMLQDSSLEQAELSHGIGSSRRGRGGKRPRGDLMVHEPPVSNGLNTHSVQMSASGKEPSFILKNEKKDSLCLGGGRNSGSTSEDGGSVRKLVAGARRVLPSEDLTDQICGKQCLTSNSNSATLESQAAARPMRKRPGGLRRRRRRIFEDAQLGFASADADMRDPYQTLCNMLSPSSDSTHGKKTSGKKFKQRQHSGGNSPELRVSLQKLHISSQEKEAPVSELPTEKSKNQNPFSINGFSDTSSHKCETATGMLRAPRKLHVQTSSHSVDSGKKPLRKPSKNPHLSASNGFDEAAMKQNSSSPVAHKETFKEKDTPVQDLAEAMQEKSTQMILSSSGKSSAIRRSKRAPHGLPWTWYDDREYAHTCRICGKTFLLLDRLQIHTAMHQRARQQQE